MCLHSHRPPWRLVSGRKREGELALDRRTGLRGASNGLAHHIGSTRPGTAQVAKAKVGLIALTEGDLHISRSAYSQKLPTEDPLSEVHRPQGLGSHQVSTDHAETWPGMRPTWAVFRPPSLCPHTAPSVGKWLRLGMPCPLTAFLLSSSPSTVFGNFFTLASNFSYLPSFLMLPQHPAHFFPPSSGSGVMMGTVHLYPEEDIPAGHLTVWHTPVWRLAQGTPGGLGWG